MITLEDAEAEARWGPSAADPQPSAPIIAATPFVWRDPREIPERRPIYGNHYIRQFVSTTLAPGGVGKTTLGIAEHLAMVTGRPLLGITAVERVRTWIFNAEDPRDELERRIAAACIHFGIDPVEIAGRLFVDSGRDMRIVIATQARDGAMIARPVVDELIATIRENRIDVISVDPFVSSHAVTENDNNAIDAVAKTWADIANATGCAVELVHHVRKTAPGEEITIDDGRGAVALINAARSARVLNPMSEAEASRLGVDNRRLHFRADNGKASMFPPPPSDKATWFKMASVCLGNGANGLGDNVGVVTTWSPPDPLADVTVNDLLAAQRAIADGRWRENVQAKDWVGKPVADALALDLEKSADKAKVKTLLKLWLASGALVIVQDKDEKGNMRPFVEVGEWANE